MFAIALIFGLVFVFVFAFVFMVVFAFVVTFAFASAFILYPLSFILYPCLCFVLVGCFCPRLLSWTFLVVFDVTLYLTRLCAMDLFVFVPWLVVVVV